MPIASVSIKPGLDVEQTPVLNSAGIVDCNLIRFREGLVEKLGGWRKFYPQAVLGVPTALHAWSDQRGNDWLAIGATRSLTVVSGGAGRTITPLLATRNVPITVTTTAGQSAVVVTDTGAGVPAGATAYFQTPVSAGGIVLSGAYAVTARLNGNQYTIDAGVTAPNTGTYAGVVPVFTTTAGSGIVAVALADYGPAVGGAFAVLAPTTVGGILLSGTYPIQTVVNSGLFTIQATPAATASVTAPEDNGLVQVTYYLPGTLTGTGYGLGGYGLGGYGTGTLATMGYGTGGYGLGGYGSGTTEPVLPGVPLAASDWTLANWGQILVACAPGGPIFQWDPSSAATVATPIQQAPQVNDGIFVAMPERIMVAWGSTTSGAQDPLLLRWSDVEDFTDWTPTSANQAGSLRLPTGSLIVGALQAPQQALVWTDVDLWAMTYIGPQLIFGVNLLASGCGLAGRGAATVLGTTVYWLSQKGFYSYAAGGVPAVAPCPVWDRIFQDMRPGAAATVRAGANSPFNEVAWYYQSTAAQPGQNDSYVKYNVLEGTWDMGRLARSAWTDQSVLGAPIGAAPTGYVYQHEVAPDADGAPMNPYFVTGYFVVDNAQSRVFVDKLIPDFRYGALPGATGATVRTTLLYKDWPSDAAASAGPYLSASASPEWIDTRVRGALVAMRVESSDAGSFWRVGNYRYRWAAMGRR